jgi:hypothetical protein
MYSCSNLFDTHFLKNSNTFSSVIRLRKEEIYWLVKSAFKIVSFNSNHLGALDNDESTQIM